MSSSSPSVSTDLSFRKQIALSQFSAFWEDAPQRWLANVEHRFASTEVQDENKKYEFVVGQLGANVSLRMAHFIDNPPRENRWKAFKGAILKEYGESESVKVKKLFQTLQLGDLKPSQLRERADGVSEAVCKTLWLELLPSEMRTVLVVSADEMAMSRLAAMADKMHEVAKPEVVAVTESRSRSPFR